MANISIRKLDDEVVARLKVRAKANQRSLEAEVRALLGEAANCPSPQEFGQLAAQIRAMTPGAAQVDGTVLIREDRDGDHGRDPGRDP